MTRIIRCVIADDSALSRKIVRTAIESIEGVEVLAVCRDGLDAVEKCVELKPDFVSMDLEMPRMNGIDAVRELRKKCPQTKVVMVSSLTTSGATVTTQALAAGAFDFVLKPVARNVDECIATLAAQLKEKLEIVRMQLGIAASLPGSRVTGGNGTVPQAAERASTNEFATTPPNKMRVGEIEAICIGVSTGGPVALQAVIPQLPADLPVPVFIVQHMPAVFTKSLAEQLDRTSAVKVLEGADGMLVEPGHVYIAPGGQQMKPEFGVIKSKIRITDDAAESNARPSVDYLFRHCASLYGRKLLAAVLTGMGNDGEAGCGHIKRSGGHVITQNAASCVVYGMPRAVEVAGLSDQVLSLDQIAAALIQCSLKGAHVCR